MLNVRQNVSYIWRCGDEAVPQVSPSATEAFFLRLLRPVAKIMLRHGVSYRDLADLCKNVYVAAATDDYGVDGRPANVSRVAMLTGMTRRDVRKVRLRLDQDEQQTLSRMNSATRILSGWYQDPEFVSANGGEPLPLSESGESPSFAELSRRYAGDIPVSTTLKELKSAGAVTVNEDGKLIAQTRYYMPGSKTPATNETVLRSGSVLEDIGNTVDYNLGRRPPDPGRFEGRATNRNIDPDSVDEFRAFVEKEGQLFLEKVDEWLSDHEVDENSSETLRLGIGAYWIEGQALPGETK